MPQIIPANRMSARDGQAARDILATVEKQWSLCSHLAFVSDGALHMVCVGQKHGSDDPWYYVFRAYSTHEGIEHESRHDGKAAAIAARFAAAEGHADLIYDNSRAK